MRTIGKTIEIDAPVEKVYEVLVNPQFTRKWANAFSEGTYVETDWKPGSEVVHPGQAQSRLDIKAGALAEEHIEMHEPLWDKAIQLIKELAEK